MLRTRSSNNPNFLVRFDPLDCADVWSAAAKRGVSCSEILRRAFLQQRDGYPTAEAVLSRLEAALPGWGPWLEANIRPLWPAERVTSPQAAAEALQQRSQAAARARRTRRRKRYEKWETPALVAKAAERDLLAFMGISEPERGLRLERLAAFQSAPWSWKEYLERVLDLFEPGDMPQSTQPQHGGTPQQYPQGSHIYGPQTD